MSEYLKICLNSSSFEIVPQDVISESINIDYKNKDIKLNKNEIINPLSVNQDFNLLSANNITQISKQKNTNSKCQISNCSCFRKLGFLFCNIHKCDIKSCNEKKYFDSFYCINHTCPISGCEIFRLNKIVCNAHLCHVANCDNIKFRNTDYCFKHNA